MSENIKISMFKVVGSPFCVASGDGQKIHKHLDAALRANQDVVLSFHNVTALTTPFLTAAVGELYGTFSEEKIRSLLKVEDIEPDDLAFLESVVRDVKLYFKDPQKFNQIFQEVLEDDDNEI
ncbi:MAG: STAS-like domain-containing protein [Candidatus Poribacteria bacterium]|nr:STAS-like domain-containing protein [Candidatus Poribacteria bacterium]